jgi:FKBP-type peptidyl-prolyl cis-trans isomerase
MAAGGMGAGDRVGGVSAAKEVTIELIVAGDGEHYPKAGQLATIHYTAYVRGEGRWAGEGRDGGGACRGRAGGGIAPCANGALFDSTRTRSRPFRFRIGEEQVIEGLEKAVALLSVGERAKAVIPASHAYGAQGFPGKVPPNMDLIFDLELLSLH